MAKLTIFPLKKIKTKLAVPGDKSISHRAAMIGALATGRTQVVNFLPSADCLATVDCLRRLGARLELTGTTLEIFGNGLHGLSRPKEELNVGNSGTSIRLLSGILAGQPFVSRITGDESIQRRPMRRVADPLRAMGAGIEGKVKNDNLYAPLKISGGGLEAIEYALPVPSAQVKSAVLLAGLFARGETAVLENNHSRDHTERMLFHFGARVQGARVQGGCLFCGANVDVPGDISSAAFFLVAAAICPKAELLVRGVGVNPTRTGIIEVLHRMGAAIEVSNEQIISEEPRADILVQSSKLYSIRLSGEIIPRIIDEIPVIAVAATQANGTTEIRGARELRVKESDRIATVASELKKMGARIKELDDGLLIEGPTALQGARIDSHGDHRIAMAAAVAGLIAEGETIIENTDCIETSFPGFSSLLASLK